MKAFRNEYIEAFKEKGAKLTFNYILMKVCAQVLMEMPDVNASYADRMITHHKHVYEFKDAQTAYDIADKKVQPLILIDVESSKNQ